MLAYMFCIFSRKVAISLQHSCVGLGGGLEAFRVVSSLEIVYSSLVVLLAYSRWLAILAFLLNGMDFL